MITRFAPAPTGFLHLGHVVNAVFVWGVARRLNGTVLLRIEDHDRQRSRAEYEKAILEDLAWLGFEADAPMVRQGERGDIYRHALARLRDRGLVYACSCSRATIAGGTGPFGPAEQRYPGVCRDRGLAEESKVGLRVRLDDSVERFDDLRHGPQEQRPAEQCGDVLVRDREGNWTYQFAAAVDDLVQGVTLVIRGDDLLASTGRQIQLARLLGRDRPPRFLHHPLIMKSADQKLSKSDRDTGVRDLRAQGWSPPRVIGRAAFLAGLMSEQCRLLADDVSLLFADMMSPFTKGLE
ncbi:MAG TPA: glutamate--tRNA ligase family protein [Vicinamibacterales bacterium]|nr:glutamate--tRNA ligase family protein [Vicinamibacterales bacterium]